MQRKNNIKNLIDLRVWLVLVFSVTSFSFASATDISFSIYGGFNKAGHSSVSFAGAFEEYGINNGKYSVEGWEGKSFESPIYYGYRMGFPLPNKPAFKIAIDFNHSKVKAKRLPSNLKRLEFTDGLNTLTLNLLYTFENFFNFEANVSPYVGAGFGLAYPHVDVEGVAGKN
jgi:lipid A oxidase